MSSSTDFAPEQAPAAPARAPRQRIQRRDGIALGGIGGLEHAHGFTQLLRFAPGLPSVAEMMAPYAEELAAFELEKLVPNGRVTLRPRPVNWKNVGDNYSDGLHIPVAHPGLTRLFGIPGKTASAIRRFGLAGTTTAETVISIAARAVEAIRILVFIA